MQCTDCSSISDQVKVAWVAKATKLDIIIALINNVKGIGILRNAWIHSSLFLFTMSCYCRPSMHADIFNKFAVL